MRFVSLVIFLILSMFLSAQVDSYTVVGVVMESSSAQPVEYATVVVIDKTSGNVMSGTTTDANGRFEVTVNSQDITVELSFIGFTLLIVDEVVFVNNKADLGLLKMGEDAEALDEVLITAEKSTTEFKLDKRVFNVGTDLSSTGASALEVLNNVPSVDVNIEGDVSLRGATGVQMLINGKPSILTDDSSNALGTITADMIEKVEVITNPSAKYEAEGTAGIINIILKKNQKNGLNGSISVNTGIPHNHSVGVSLNRRTEKFNLFTQMGVGYRELPRDNASINRDKIRDTELYSTGVEYRNELFYNFNLGTDYYINPHNVITLSGSYAYEIEDQPSSFDFEFSESGNLVRSWSRSEVTAATNPKIQYELQYKRDFTDHKEHQLLFSAIGRYFGKALESDFTNVYTLGTDDLLNQKTESEFQEGKYTFNLDYTKPYGKHWKIETGAQYLTNDVSNDYKVSDEIQGVFVEDPSLTNIFEYDQKVLGIYGTGSYEGNLWGVKLGLRAENTDLTTLLVNDNLTNQQNFTNLFPSAHLSYKFTQAISFQAGYSRRIFRPRLWDLNPFFNIKDNFNIRTGNPNLLPEYTDSYEIGSIFILEEVTLNVNVYHRYTTDRIERVSFFADNVNTTRPENIGTNKATGIEANFKYIVSKKFSFNGDTNYNVFKREGRFSDQSFDFSADKWSGKLTAKYKISKGIDVELTGRHDSRERAVQGIVSPRTHMDGGLRIKILNGKGVFNVSGRDIFASRIREKIIDEDDFYLFGRGFRGRFLTLGFSYGFGKGEAMQYSGRRR